ncbi:uracil-DNA glycosylase [Gracilibacillus marinus]|jgi:uracil-DNA glycosylase|uniref:Uracil-DNA glycosylase n=1 Tax=Gracilibacillus marinus TaxID=630535 RepID=A0ABV8W0K3_9BACI
MNKHIFTNDWEDILSGECNQNYYKKLHEFLREEYQTSTIYPKAEDIFNALHFTSFEDVKVVILGQDPYHGPNQAHGLSFSVNKGVPVPPSLKNIYKELQNDVGVSIPNHGYLKEWADQGVLLLNTVLTVRSGEAHSHKGRGWEQFTNQIIKKLNDKSSPIVYILWGKAAEAKETLIDTSKHYTIKSPHPSPLSAHRGFFNSKPFSKVNQLLIQEGKEPIDWQISSFTVN